MGEKKEVDNIIGAVSPDGTAFDLIGPVDSPVIALIHGLGLSRQIWQHHLPALSKEYRVLNYDLYGHGDSAQPLQTASLSVYADQLAGLIEHLNIGAVSVVGFSIGGMINRRFAMDYSDKLTAIVILNSPHDRGEEAQQQVEERARQARELGSLATLDDALKRWFTTDYLSKGTGATDVREWRQKVDDESYAQAAWVLANGVRELINPQPPIDKPALIMTCENDTGSTPLMSRDIASEIEHSAVQIVPGLKHLGLMEEPNSFTRPILEFLDSQLN